MSEENYYVIDKFQKIKDIGDYEIYNVYSILVRWGDEDDKKEKIDNYFASLEEDIKNKKITYTTPLEYYFHIVNALENKFLHLTVLLNIVKVKNNFIEELFYSFKSMQKIAAKESNLQKIYLEKLSNFIEESYLVYELLNRNEYDKNNSYINDDIRFFFFIYLSSFFSNVFNSNNLIVLDNQIRNRKIKVLKDFVYFQEFYIYRPDLPELVFYSNNKTETTTKKVPKYESSLNYAIEYNNLNWEYIDLEKETTATKELIRLTIDLSKIVDELKILEIKKNGETIEEWEKKVQRKKELEIDYTYYQKEIDKNKDILFNNQKFRELNALVDVTEETVQNSEVDKDFKLDLSYNIKDYESISKYYEEARKRVLDLKEIPEQRDIKYYFNGLSIPETQSALDIIGKKDSGISDFYNFTVNDLIIAFCSPTEFQPAEIDKIFDFMSNSRYVFIYDINNLTSSGLLPASPSLTEENKKKEVKENSLSGLIYLTKEDIQELSKLPSLLTDGNWFEWTHKEYISNIFYKTNLLKVHNTFDGKNEEPKKGLKQSSISFDNQLNTLVSIAGGFNNIVAQIPILSQDYPTNQFLSSSEPSYQFNFVSKTSEKDSDGLADAIRAIEYIRASTHKFGKEYKFIPDAPFILVDSFITRLFGSFKEEYVEFVPLSKENYKVNLKKTISIESTEHRTLESSPGASAYIMRVSESNVYDVETLRETTTNKTNKEQDKEFMQKAIDLVLSNCGTQNPNAFVKNDFVQELGDELNWATEYFRAEDFLTVALRSQTKEKLKEKLKEKNILKTVDRNLREIAKILDGVWNSLNSISRNYYYFGKEWYQPDVDDASQRYFLNDKPINFKGIKIKDGLDFSDSQTRDTFSQHYFGSAVDIIVPGVDVFLVASLLEQETHRMGLGIYGQKIIQQINDSDISGTISPLILLDTVAYTPFMGEGPASESGFIHFDLNLNLLNKDTYEAAFTNYATSKGKSEAEIQTIVRRDASSRTEEEKVIAKEVRDLKLANSINDDSEITTQSVSRYWSADKGDKYAIQYTDVDGVTNAVDIFKYKVKVSDAEELTLFNYIKKYRKYFNSKNDLTKDAKLSIVDLPTIADHSSLETTEEENNERQEENLKITVDNVNYTLKTDRNSKRYDALLNPNFDGGNKFTNNSWKERVEQVLGEKSSDFGVGTSEDTQKFKDLDDKLKQSLMNKFQNRGITNESEVTTFGANIFKIMEADPGYFKEVKTKGELQSALEDYFNANGLVAIFNQDFIDLNAEEEIDKIKMKLVQISIVDPLTVGTFSENKSKNYDDARIASLIKMVCNFKYLASLFLIEPEIYLEDKKEIQDEYTNIRNELYGISPIPSFFNNLTFGLCGSLLPTAEDILEVTSDFSANQKDNTKYNSTNSFLFYNFMNDHERFPDSFAYKFLKSIKTEEIGFFKKIIYGTLFVIGATITAIAVTAAAPIIGVGTGISVAISGIVGFLGVTSENNEVETVEPNIGSFKGGVTSIPIYNIIRILENLSRKTFLTSINYKDDLNFGLNYSPTLDRKNLFREIYLEKPYSSLESLELNELMKNVEDGSEVSNLPNAIIRQFVEQNPVMKEFKELASIISTNTLLNNLISYDYINEDTNEKEKAIFIGKQEFDPEIAKDWIMFLAGFTYVNHIDLIGVENEEFEDNYTYEIAPDNLNGYYKRKHKEDDYLNPFSVQRGDDKLLLIRYLDTSLTKDEYNQNTQFRKVEKTYRYEDEAKQKAYAERLKNQNKSRLAYLKVLIENIINELTQFDFFMDNLGYNANQQQIEFDFGTENAYPDIDLPLDPANPFSNVNLGPGFFYYEEKLDSSVLKQTKLKAQQILNNSLNFMNNLEKGIYSGDAEDFKERTQDQITKGIIINNNDASKNVTISEIEKQIAIVANSSTLTASTPIVSGTSNIDLSISDLNIMSVQELLNDEVNQNDVFNSLKIKYDELELKSKAIESAFGSRTGYITDQDLTSLNFLNNFKDKDYSTYTKDQLLALADDKNMSEQNISSIVENYGQSLIKNAPSIKMAYPTFRFYLIEEDANESDNIFVFDDFYSFNAIKDFTVYKSRKLAADTAVIRLQNISGTLDGTKFAAIRDIDYEINDRIIEKDQIGQVPTTEPVQSVVLRPGVCCQLRAGYSSNPSELTILLSGRIADVAWSNNGDMCEVTVQSFGVELETRKYGASDVDTGLDNISFHTTHKLLGWCMFRNELKHFGRYKRERLFQKGESKEVVISKETHIGSGDVSSSTTAFEFFTSNWGWFAFAEVVLAFVNFGSLVGGGKDLVKQAVKEVVEEGTEAVAKEAAKEAVEQTAKKATLNVFSRNIMKVFGFASQAIENTPNLFGVGKLINYIFSNGIFRINHSSKIVNELIQEVETAYLKRIPASITSITAQQAEDVIEFAVKQAFEEVITKRATSTAANPNILITIGRLIPRLIGLGSNPGTINQVLWSTNPTTLSNILFKYTSQGLSAGVAGSTRELIRNRLLIESVSKETNLITTGIIKTFTGFSLGLQRSAKLAIIIPTIMYGVGKAWDSIAVALGYIKDLILGVFNPYDEKLALSPQDDALYCPHPDKYISKNNLNSIGQISRKAVKALSIGLIGMDITNTLTNPTEMILLSRTLLMDKRLDSNKGENVFKIKNSTIWELFHEMSLRHCGWVYGARQYGQALEYRMFFGLPDQRYFAKPLSNKSIRRLNDISDVFNGIKKWEDVVDKEFKSKLYSLNSPDQERQKLATYQGEIPALTAKTILMEEWLRITNDRFIPFRGYHSISSRTNLVANNIIGSNNDVINEIAILFLENNPEGIPQYTQRVIRAHDNMSEDQVHSKAVKYDNCKGFNAALRYGTSELVNCAKEMYRGELLILGNPKINPYDICILDDEYSEMFGPIEVEAVTHIFSMDTGFITEIKPNALVTANEGLTFPVLNSVAMYDIGKELAKTAGFGFRSLEEDKQKEIVTKLVTEWMNRETEAYSLDPFQKDRVTETSYLARQFNSKNPEFQNILIDRIMQQIKSGEIVLQSDILNPNVKLNSYLDTSNLTLALTTTALGLLAARARLGASPAMLVGALGLASATTPQFLEKQLSTPGSFLVNKLLSGDMLLSQVTDGTLIQVYPLFKYNRPLLFGGFQQINTKKSVKNKLGNIFFEASQAMNIFNTISKEYSDRENIIYSNPSFVVEKVGNIAQSLLPYKLPDNTVVGYLGSYQKDKVINAAVQGGTL